MNGLKNASILRAVPILFLLFPGSISGQATDFGITSWDTRNGLPEAMVQALAVRPEGGVWVATEGGLCLFNGSNCKSLPIEETRRLPQKSFTSFFIAHDQSLWAGTEGGGLLHLEQGHLKSFDSRNGLSDGYVRAIYEDSRGHLWVGTDYGLFQLNGAAFQHVPLGKNNPPQFVHAIVEDGSGRLIVGGKSLFIIDSGVVSSVQSWSESGRPQIKSLLYTKQGRLIIGTVDGAFEMVSGHFLRLPFPHVDIESLCQSSDGAIWAGTVSAGLWRIKGTVVAKVGFEEGNFVRTVLAMTTDARGRLWVGTQTGLTRIEETSVHFIRSPALAVDRETLAVSAEGSVYLVNGNVYRIENRKLQQQSFLIPSNTRILDALYAKDRSIWLGTAGHGVYHMDPKGRVIQYSTRTLHKLSTDYPRGIAEGTRGDIWVATELGVDIIRRDAGELISLSNSLPSRSVRTMFLDHSGCMWIGTDEGPAVSCNGVLVQNQATSSLTGEEIWAIAEDASGTMWFGTRQNGIYAFTDSGFRHLTVADGLPSNDICGLIVNRSGDLWVSSLDMIFSFPTSSIAFKRSEGDFVVPRSYVLPSGTEGLTFTRGRIQNALLDSHGTVWFASDHGAAFIDTPAHSPDNSSDDPIPAIRSMIIDNSFIPVSAKIRTPPNPRQIVISFGADYLSSEQEMLLMYRLKGVDNGWTISMNPQQAEYSNLPAGSYWFELRACDRAQPERWKTTTYLITVPVIWYRSPWFSASLAVLILVVVIVAYLMHLRRLHYGFRLILEERSRVAREMHDTIIQGCNGVAMLLEAEASSRGEVGQNSLLNIARTQIRDTIVQARNALWNLRQSNADSDYLHATLRDIAAHATATYNIPVDVCCPSKHYELPASSTHEIIMIVREAVINAGTHGSPRKIVITARIVSGRFSIEVADDGIGFDVAAASTPVTDHYGIRGMRERAATIGAQLEIYSIPGSGTVVRVSLS